jgi:putative ABC transport system permease protein
VRVRRVPHTVIGVLDRKGQSMVGQDQDDVVLIPISTARKRVLGGQQVKSRSVQSITVRVRDGEDVTQTEQELRDLLRQRHRLQPNQEDDFFLRNLAEVLAAQEASSRVLAMLLAAIASVSLFVGGIGIMNIMLVSVTERTREIGLRMAVGARGRDILMQFLVEAVTLALIGGLVGIALGIAASFGVGHFAGWRTEIRTAAVVMAFGFAGAIGVFFGFYPARKAARLAPIDALRHE